MSERTSAPWYARLHWQIFGAMAIGAAAGMLGGAAFADRVAWLGTLFVRLLRMVVVPLVLTSVVAGVASIGGGRSVGRLFAKTFGYYVVSSVLAILVGLCLANLIHPGAGAQLATFGDTRPPAIETPGSLVDMCCGWFPPTPCRPPRAAT